MSLRQRVERAQQAGQANKVELTPEIKLGPETLGPRLRSADSASAGSLVPIPTPVPPNPARVLAREELLGAVRLRLQNEVLAAFDAKLFEVFVVFESSCR